MAPRPVTEDLPAPLYDVLLEGRPPDSLRPGCAVVSVQTAGAQTALRRRVSGPWQLDTLLEKLGSSGVRLLDIHRLPGPAGEQQTYEVRVAGEVGESLLRYLSWAHHLVPARTRIRICAAADDLLQFLQACTESGASIQRVHLVDPPRACGRSG